MPQKFKPLPYKFSTKLACEIAGIDPLRLNESIAGKDGYTCAPKTRAGVARQFEEFDITALFIYRFLTSTGYTQKLASMYACGVLEALKHSYHTLPERFDFPLNPFPDQAIACQKDDPTIFSHGEGLISYATIGFNITLLRKEIQDRMEFIAARERNTFGADE